MSKYIKAPNKGALMYTQYIQRMPRLGEKEINKKSLTLLGVLPKIPFSYIVPFIDFFF